MGSRPLNSDHDLILCKFGFRKCFGVSSQPDHWANHRWLSYTIHFSLHITIWSQSHVVFPQNKRRQHFKMTITFWFVVSSWRSSSLRLSSPLQNFLNHHCTIHPLAVLESSLHYTSISSSWAQCIADVASCLLLYDPFEHE